MINVTDKLEMINTYYSEMNDGGLFAYEQEEQSLIYKFNSCGGEFEDKDFYVKFIYVELFNMPISLSQSICGESLDTIKVGSNSDCNKLISKDVIGNLSIDNSIIFRFYAKDNASPYFILCNDIDYWLS